MKKIYTFIAAALISMGAMAQDLTWETYNETLVVEVNGVSTEPAATDFYMARQDDGKYSFKIENLFLVDENGEKMYVGSLTLADVEAIPEANGDETLKANSGVQIENGNDPTVDFWVGPMVTEACNGAVPVVLNGTKRDKRVYVTIDIDITSVMGQIVKVTLGEPLPEIPAQPELNWETYNEILVVEVNGVSTEPAATDFYMARQDDGKYSFKIENLFLVDENGEKMYVGSLTLADVEAIPEANGDETLKANSGVQIENGNDPTVDFWVGPMVTESCNGSVPVVLNGTKRDKRVYVTIDIDITSVMGQIVKVTLGEPLPEVPDAIARVKSTATTATYTLTGVKTTATRKGIYIINGKKVIK